ncbi:lipocalin family protein [uncultured Fibrobacter sp.]|jgi:hypothetical protein|uniref:lipocalin family protein n=1 Tax=uncultured Fibrobacter sp. TaxID=261512 RepID=UPI0025E77390|nr:lipocalin family protein [uncultured Fibrobacter sp.]
MKNIILTASVFSLALAFCGCSSDEEEESLSDKCRKGDDSACLVGTWNMLAIQDAATDYNVIADFTTGPGRLVINEDGTFTYTYATAVSSLMSSSCGGLNDSGKWTYDKATKTITIKFTVGEQCNPNPTISSIVKVNETDMTLNGKVFQINEDFFGATQPVEYYKRVAIQ